MYEENRDAKQRLMEIGRKEFLVHGYMKASMRNISAAANVTTGAIYFFFHNKEEFFKAILDETATDLKKHLQNYTESEINESKSSAENDRELITFLFSHKEEIIILLKKAEGTVYEGYSEELCEVLENAFMVFYERYGGLDKDRNIVKIVVRMRLQGYYELLYGDYTLEQAIRYTELLAFYGDSGFTGMMKKYNKMYISSVG